MSKRCPRPLAAFVAIVSLGMPGRSQLHEVPILRGELRSDAVVYWQELQVELVATGGRGAVRRADIQFDGNFVLRGLASGEYTFRVIAPRGEVVCQELVNVLPGAGPLVVRLPSRDRTPVTAETISMNQLRNPPAPKAFKAVISAQKFVRLGQPKKAIAELERAIRISPEYADAYNNLAVQHMRAQRFEEARQELTRALAIAGPNATGLSNLAYAQTRLHHVVEAEEAARAALRLDSGAAQAHLILGCILVSESRTRAEGVRHLEQAAETMPAARDTLAKVRGAMAEAR